MKHLLFAAALLVSSVPLLAADVDLSVSIGQPGFYGRIDIGDYPQPRLIYRQPMMIERIEMDRPPIYLRVPPGHARNWRKHCRSYNACGERVYFVQDNWYQREYVPRYRQQQRDHRDEYRGGRGNDRRDNDRGNNDRNDRGGERHGNDRGHGRDH